MLGKHQTLVVCWDGYLVWPNPSQELHLLALLLAEVIDVKREAVVLARRDVVLLVTRGVVLLVEDLWPMLLCINRRIRYIPGIIFG
jgi:hypothetical protein